MHSREQGITAAVYFVIDGLDDSTVRTNVFVTMSLVEYYSVVPSI